MWSVTLFKRNKKILDRVLRRFISSGMPTPIKHALVLSKMTRYDVEKHSHPGVTAVQLEALIRDRGSDYDNIMEHHQRHKDYEEYVLQTFKSRGIKTKLLKRLDYSQSWIEWCDAVFPVGGDGTFLLAASRVPDNTKLVVGFNSDPEHSEGFLCLPKMYSNSVDEVLHRLEKGLFSWLFRSRIRVNLKRKENDPPEHLHDKNFSELQRIPPQWSVKDGDGASVTPAALALNEVFVGEKLAAQVSYFEMRPSPQTQSTRVKCSGVCVSTGTGSSSWHLSMNRVTAQCVKQVLNCAVASSTQPYQDIADKYNDALLFDPESKEMCYTVRELICAAVWPSPPGLVPRGFTTQMQVRSHCRDARLVIDGGISYSFNDGSEAVFELHPEDALRTIVL